ncbi:MAG: hypothetical protein GY830_02980, partial [Bacteroidetes bacterium]|nr:hypothetical protein [Bacteroidota bacterium]
PTNYPTNTPTNAPTNYPTNAPTNDPTFDPTFDPTSDPTYDPTTDPTNDPTGNPTSDPTDDPTNNPTPMPTPFPTSPECTECNPNQTVYRKPFTNIIKYDFNHLNTFCNITEFIFEKLICFELDDIHVSGCYKNITDNVKNNICDNLNLTDFSLPFSNPETPLIKIELDECIDKSINVTIDGAIIAEDNVPIILHNATGYCEECALKYRFGCNFCGSGCLNDTEVISENQDDYIKYKFNFGFCPVEEFYIELPPCRTYEDVNVMVDCYKTEVSETQSLACSEPITAFGNSSFARINLIDQNCTNSTVSVLVGLDGNNVVKPEESPIVIKGDKDCENCTVHHKFECGPPTNDPTQDPTTDPTNDPTNDPTFDPTNYPTSDPTNDPTNDPTFDPTNYPTNYPTNDPTNDPTFDPTNYPTSDPTNDPTNDPAFDPTNDPTFDPTNYPTSDPTNDPTSNPTYDPTNDPTFDPTNYPTSDPTNDPTFYPTSDPTNDPTSDPTYDPTNDPTFDPTNYPTSDPTNDPTFDPTNDPTNDPTSD